MRRPPVSTRTTTLVPYTTLCRSGLQRESLAQRGHPLNHKLRGLEDLVGLRARRRADDDFRPELVFAGQAVTGDAGGQRRLGVFAGNLAIGAGEAAAIIVLADEGERTRVGWGRSGLEVVDVRGGRLVNKT